MRRMLCCIFPPSPEDDHPQPGRHAQETERGTNGRCSSVSLFAGSDDDQQEEGRPEEEKKIASDTDDRYGFVSCVAGLGDGGGTGDDDDQGDDENTIASGADDRYGFVSCVAGLGDGGSSGDDDQGDDDQGNDDQQVGQRPEEQVIQRYISGKCLTCYHVFEHICLHSFWQPHRFSYVSFRFSIE
ncbi:MAG: hypothetical protein FE835_18965 [Gammaproteobacteria bacterium]|nr:hypothetical protein [Gammaproteobacteria bacterium]